jgi:serine/threonine-protein kinase
LWNALFAARRVTVESDQPEGTVVSTNPAAGTEADWTTKIVTINVSEGPPEPAPVPPPPAHAAPTPHNNGNNGGGNNPNDGAGNNRNNGGNNQNNNNGGGPLQRFFR